MAVPTFGAPISVPAQQRLRRHNEPLPTSGRQDPRERGKEGTIGRSKRGPRLLPPKHRKLMPQNKQFHVLGELVAPASDKQPQHRREREVSEGDKHPPMLPEPTAARVESWNLCFETPQASSTNTKQPRDQRALRMSEFSNPVRCRAPDNQS